MSFLNKLIGDKKIAVSEEEKERIALYAQSVIINFNYGFEGDTAFYELSEKLYKLLEKSSLGVFDGYEMAIDNSDGSFYLYGPSAENLFIEVKPILESAEFLDGAEANLRFGNLDKEAQEIDVKIEFIQS